MLADCEEWQVLIIFAIFVAIFTIINIIIIMIVTNVIIIVVATNVIVVTLV